MCVRQLYRPSPTSGPRDAQVHRREWRGGLAARPPGGATTVSQRGSGRAMAVDQGQDDIRKDFPVSAAEADIERDLALLSSISEDLSATADYRSALARAAHRVIPTLGDVCVIELIPVTDADADAHTEADGPTEAVPVEPRALALAHVDPSAEAELAQVLPHFGPRGGAAGPRRQALETGTAQVLADLDDAFWQRVTTDTEQLALLHRLAIRHVVSVPLIARGRALRLLSVGLVQSGRRFTAANLAIIGDLAGRMALAIDNARLHEAGQEARRAAEQTAAQLARLQSVTSRLSQARTVDEVGDVVVTDGAAGLDSTTAALCLLSEDGDSLNVVKEAGYPPGLMDE